MILSAERTTKNKFKITRCALLSCIMLTSCVIMGDAVVKVKGSILTAPECTIRLNGIKDDWVVSTRQISGNFQETFIVPAGKRDYKIDIVCQDGGRYESETYRLGGKHDPFGRVIDLGDLVLQQN